MTSDSPLHHQPQASARASAGDGDAATGSMVAGGDELRRLNRTLQAHTRSAQALLHAEDESQYLAEVCRIIVQDCGHAMVWIGYAEQDEGKTVRPMAYAGFEAGYLESLHITWADTERGRGPTGTAIRTGKPCMCPVSYTHLTLPTKRIV